MATRGWEHVTLDQIPQKATAGFRRSQSKYKAMKTDAKTFDELVWKLMTPSGMPMPVTEFRFYPQRKWRFDYAWPDHKLALEVQGGLFVNGRHSRGAALLKEHEKLNTAAQLGWRILFVTPQQMASGEVVEIVRKAL